MLVQRRWRWTNIETTLGQIIVFAGESEWGRYDVSHLQTLTCGTYVLTLQPNMCRSYTPVTHRPTRRTAHTLSDKN